MKKEILYIFFMMCVVPMFSQEVLTKESPVSFAETVKVIESTLKSSNFTIFAKIDQADAAKKAGLSMNPGIVFIFGNPKAGTSLMQENPVWVLDLPLKVAVYQDSNDITYISTFDMKKIAKRNKLSKTQMPKIQAMSDFLEKLLMIR